MEFGLQYQVFKSDHWRWKQSAQHSFRSEMKQLGPLNS